MEQKQREDKIFCRKTSNTSFLKVLDGKMPVEKTPAGGIRCDLSPAYSREKEAVVFHCLQSWWEEG